MYLNEIIFNLVNNLVNSLKMKLKLGWGINSVESVHLESPQSFDATANLPLTTSLGIQYTI